MEQEAVAIALKNICEDKHIKYELYNLTYLTCENDKSHVKLYNEYARYSMWG